MSHGRPRHVLAMDDGRALDPAYVMRLFQVIRKQGDPLPELTFHGLRHGVASLMLVVSEPVREELVLPRSCCDDADRPPDCGDDCC